MATEGMNRAASLFNHILAVERLEDEKADIAADINERIKIAVDVDGFDKTALKEIIKRRKKGTDACATMDAMITDYEDMLQAHIDSVKDRSTRDNTLDPVEQPETVEGELIAAPVEQGALPDYTEQDEPVDAEFAEVDDDPDDACGGDIGSVDGEGYSADPDDGMTDAPEPFDEDDNAPW